MKDILLALLQLAVITAKLCGPGGVRAVIAENLLLKQQLIPVDAPRVPSGLGTSKVPSVVLIEAGPEKAWAKRP